MSTLLPSSPFQAKASAFPSGAKVGCDSLPGKFVNGAVLVAGAKFDTRAANHRTIP
jgi:hypothetical protein